MRLHGGRILNKNKDCLVPNPKSRTSRGNQQPQEKQMALVPEMQQLDFSEAPWDEAATFALTKYPSYEIDWGSLLATN
ncbi:hypothetical protein E2562_029822 [Oryza meyeriana var. granulata]|uniref:Uncharacterized protein n=1 Tax=Oryza meyeriana var. granulata TaxID=110450 RepID=A0A6G1CUK5_9ORYZ|nr:hypothetical protein E2562_029822 [Oryza meyeriana var. granulata]